MAGGVRRIVPLTLGWEDLLRSVSVHGAPQTERLREPVPGLLLLCDGGWLLLDTGFNTALITDPALRRRYHGDPLVQPVLPGPGNRWTRRWPTRGPMTSGRDLAVIPVLWIVKADNGVTRANR